VIEAKKEEKEEKRKEYGKSFSFFLQANEVKKKGDI
jgi:hypothetical protein